MIRILDTQYGNDFVGRGEKIEELKEKIENNGIVVVTGDRGIGKTNLVKVVEKYFEGKKEKYYFESVSQFSEGISNIFLPDKITTGASGSFTILGSGVSLGKNWIPREPSILEYMEKSKKKIMFVENAHELKKEQFETIFAATSRNDHLRFILEIATSYMPEVKLRAGSHEVVDLRELRDDDIEKIVRKECPHFSDTIVQRIVSLSKGYPYAARSLAYICDNKNTEEEISMFLETLRDDYMKYNLDRIHGEVLATLDADSQAVIKKLAIAPPTLTLNLIVAFCGEDVDIPLNDIIKRGILVEESEEKFYRIYHPLFREYLRSIQPIVLEIKKRTYHEAMERVKSTPDSTYILFEVLNDPDIFEELLKKVENYVSINSAGIRALTFGELEQALRAFTHLLKISKGVDKEWESFATGNIGIVYKTKGELDKALEYHEKALKLNEKLGRKKGLAVNYTNIGLVYKETFMTQRDTHEHENECT